MIHIHNSGDTVSIQVTFSEAVYVTGTPQLMSLHWWYRMNRWDVSGFDNNTLILPIPVLAMILLVILISTVTDTQTSFIKWWND